MRYFDLRREVGPEFANVPFNDICDMFPQYDLDSKDYINFCKDVKNVRSYEIGFIDDGDEAVRKERSDAIERDFVKTLSDNIEIGDIKNPCIVWRERFSGVNKDGNEETANVLYKGHHRMAVAEHDTVKEFFDALK